MDGGYRVRVDDVQGIAAAIDHATGPPALVRLRTNCSDALERIRTAVWRKRFQIDWWL